MEPDDAAEAKYQMDGQILQGRQLTVVFAEENRKKPSEMRAREHRLVLHNFCVIIQLNCVLLSIFNALDNCNNSKIGFDYV